MKRFPVRKRSPMLALFALLALAGAAFAYWTTTGSGTGSASTGDAEVVTITQTTSPSNLFPGGPAQALKFTITNDADFDQHVGSIAVTITGTPAAGCAASNYEISGSPVTVDQTIQEHSTTSVITGATIALKETGANQDACKDASVSLSYSTS